MKHNATKLRLRFQNWFVCCVRVHRSRMFSMLEALTKIINEQCAFLQHPSWTFTFLWKALSATNSPHSSSMLVNLPHLAGNSIQQCRDDCQYSHAIKSKLYKSTKCISHAYDIIPADCLSSFDSRITCSRRLSKIYTALKLNTVICLYCSIDSHIPPYFCQDLNLYKSPAPVIILEDPFHVALLSW